MILEDPLDQFEEQEALQIMNFLVKPEHPWTLIVVSSHKRWEKTCQEFIQLKQGTMSIISN